jgi:hypothetical protein
MRITKERDAARPIKFQNNVSLSNVPWRILDRGRLPSGKRAMNPVDPPLFYLPEHLFAKLKVATRWHF